MGYSPWMWNKSHTMHGFNNTETSQHKANKITTLNHFVITNRLANGHEEWRQISLQQKKATFVHW
jgi:hypothetical protein